ncbi:hypothetical protein FRC12_018377 [Ceratobasidium sp. 428]|nr:hypothetical protein FRC12_018377 [Ceratobasidium sp. 428]
MGGALDDNIPMDMVTSKALSWVISNSQNTKSVDTALQAIAGADHSLPCEPLWNCNAAGLVQQRLHDCFTSQELPVTNSGFETLVKLGSGNLTFRLCVLYARVLNVLAWDGTKDGWNQSINVFRDVWSEFELLFDNLARHSGSEIAPSTTVGYAGISVWKQHKPYIISSFSRGTESPLGVSSYILLVLERHGDLPSYEAQLFELFYVLHRGLIDHDASDPVYKRDLVTNLVSILKHLTCDSLLMDFSYVAQVFGSAGLILNGHHSPPDSLADKVGRYGEFEKIEPELLLFLGLIGLVEVSDSIGTELGEDIHPAVDLGIVFERLVQLKIFLVSNTQGSWPPTDLPLPFPLGRVSTFNDYGLNVISNYYRLHANATTSSQKRCVGLAGGIIVGSVVGNDCILDHWRPMVTDALPLLEDSSASLRWSYPNTPCHPTLRTRAPFLDVSFFAVLSLMKHNTKEYAQRQCLAACFHEIADQIQRVSQESREPIANELIQKTMEYDLFDVLVQALLTIRHDCPSTKPWRGIYAEPKLGWWGARLLELAHQSAHQQDNMGNGVGDVGSAIETFCLTEITPNTKTAFELTPDTDAMPEYSTEKASASANSFIMRLAQFKSVLLAEMRNPTDISDDPIEEVLEESTGDLKPSWSTRLQRTRRKLTIRPPNSHTELV